MSLITDYLRVIALILLLSLFGLSNAHTSNQKVTIEFKNVTLKDFIGQIESQANYTIVYQDTLVGNKRDVTIKVVEEPLNKVINSVLDKKGLQATFKDNAIIITKKITNSSIAEKRYISRRGCI